MMSSSIEDLKKRSNWDGTNGKSRQNLLATLGGLFF